ncbi:MAG: segregation/condensation protein A [Tenericutes bacterium]|nr:segregation/condensation protein A [Mycoplasmatota bacterium]
MQYKVTIDNFDGPLDLLLHLIKEQDIDIYDIKIEEITKQYLDYIKEMKDLNLSVASEYLVMASELIEMKSKMLLPKKEKQEDDEYEEDPREVLIERLLAYKKYKEVTSEFKDLELTRKLVFTKEPVNLSSYAKEKDIKEDLGVDDLINAFNILMQKKELDKPLATKITKKELSVSEKVKKIKDILKVRKKMNFEEVFEVQSKEEVIISFLSILEMVKKKEILLTQEGNFKSIIISLREGD